MGPKLTMSWRDNSGKLSRLGFWLPDGISVSDAIGRANTLRAALLPVVNARLDGATITYDDIVPAGPAPSIWGDYRTNLVLIFSDERGTEAIRLPFAPVSLAYDAAGPWRGFRLLPPAMGAGWVAQMAAALEPVVGPTFDPFPRTFVVGTRDIIT